MSGSLKEAQEILPPGFSLVKVPEGRGKELVFDPEVREADIYNYPSKSWTQFKKNIGDVYMAEKHEVVGNHV